jgi:hypothetical protein
VVAFARVAVVDWPTVLRGIYDVLENDQGHTEKAVQIAELIRRLRKERGAADQHAGAEGSLQRSNFVALTDRQGRFLRLIERQDLLERLIEQLA